MWLRCVERFLPWEDWGGLQNFRAAGWQETWSTFSQPFYSLNYSMAAFGAVQVWERSRADAGRAVEDLLGALTLGYTRSSPELWRSAGAALPFNREVVRRVAQSIEPALESW